MDSQSKVAIMGNASKHSFQPISPQKTLDGPIDPNKKKTRKMLLSTSGFDDIHNYVHLSKGTTEFDEIAKNSSKYMQKLYREHLKTHKSRELKSLTEKPQPKPSHKPQDSFKSPRKLAKILNPNIQSVDLNQAQHNISSSRIRQNNPSGSFRNTTAGLKSRGEYDFRKLSMQVDDRSIKFEESLRLYDASFLDMQLGNSRNKSPLDATRKQSTYRDRVKQYSEGVRKKISVLNASKGIEESFVPREEAGIKIRAEKPKQAPMQRLRAEQPKSQKIEPKKLQLETQALKPDVQAIKPEVHILELETHTLKQEIKKPMRITYTETLSEKQKPSPRRVDKPLKDTKNTTPTNNETVCTQFVSRDPVKKVQLLIPQKLLTKSPERTIVLTSSNSFRANSYSEAVAQSETKLLEKFPTEMKERRRVSMKVESFLPQQITPSMKSPKELLLSIVQPDSNPSSFAFESLRRKSNNSQQLLPSPKESQIQGPWKNFNRFFGDFGLEQDMVTNLTQKSPRSESQNQSLHKTITPRSRDTSQHIENRSINAVSEIKEDEKILEMSQRILENRKESPKEKFILDTSQKQQQGNIVRAKSPRNYFFENRITKSPTSSLHQPSDDDHKLAKQVENTKNPLWQAFWQKRSHRLREVVFHNSPVAQTSLLLDSRVAKETRNTSNPRQIQSHRGDKLPQNYLRAANKSTSKSPDNRSSIIVHQPTQNKPKPPKLTLMEQVLPERIRVNKQHQANNITKEVHDSRSYVAMNKRNPQNSPTQQLIHLANTKSPISRRQSSTIQNSRINSRGIEMMRLTPKHENLPNKTKEGTHANQGKRIRRMDVSGNQQFESHGEVSSARIEAMNLGSDGNSELNQPIITHEYLDSYRAIFGGAPKKESFEVEDSQADQSLSQEEEFHLNDSLTGANQNKASQNELDDHNHALNESGFSVLGSLHYVPKSIYIDNPGENLHRLPRNKMSFLPGSAKEEHDRILNMYKPDLQIRVQKKHKELMQELHRMEAEEAKIEEDERDGKLILSLLQGTSSALDISKEPVYKLLS